MREIGDLLSLIWITKEFPVFWKTSDIQVFCEVGFWGKRAECVQSNTCHWKGGMHDIQVYRTVCFLLDICISSPVQRFWPSAEKCLSVTVLVARFVLAKQSCKSVHRTILATIISGVCFWNLFIVCLTSTSCFFLLFLFIFFFNSSTVQSKISCS